MDNITVHTLSRPARKGEISDPFGNAILSARPVTRGYHPTNYRWWEHVRDLPFFTYLTITSMLIDPTVRLGLAMRMAPICSAEFAYKEGDEWVPGVKADNPKVKAWVERQLHRIWRFDIDKLLLNQTWGWAAAEVLWKRSKETGIIEYDTMLDRHADDIRALEYKGKLIGVEFGNVESTKHGQEVRLGINGKAVWSSFQPESGSNYGWSILRGAHSPWADKWLNGGALDVRRLFMHSDAYGGRRMWYPTGSTELEGFGSVPNQDIAQQIVEQAKSGEVMVLPSGTDENGNMLWKVEDSRVMNNPGHILQYPKDLSSEILNGMEIPDDVITAISGQGAWQGKQVPMQAFFNGLNRWLNQEVQTITTQILEPGVYWNFGAEDFEVSTKPLDVQAMEQSQAQEEGQQAPPQEQAPGGFGGPGMGQQMSLDPAQAVGEGVLNAAELVKATREVIRLRTEEEVPQRLSAGPMDDFSSTQFDLPAELAASIVGFAQSIPYEHLAEKGVENQPHITALYGLHADTEEQVRHVVKGFGPIAVQLGMTSVFESENYDVVIIEVESQGLVDLHNRIAESCPHTSNFPCYTPHVTVAFVESGMGQLYAGRSDFCGQGAVFNQLVFSDKNRQHVNIALLGAVRFAQSPVGGVTVKGKFFPGGQFIPGVSQQEVDDAASGGTATKERPARRGKKSLPQPVEGQWHRMPYDDRKKLVKAWSKKPSAETKRAWQSAQRKSARFLIGKVSEDDYSAVVESDEYKSAETHAGMLHQAYLEAEAIERQSVADENIDIENGIETDEEAVSDTATNAVWVPDNPTDAMRDLLIATRKKFPTAHNLISASHGLSVAHKAGTVEEWWTNVLDAAEQDGLTKDDIASVMSKHRPNSMSLDKHTALRDQLPSIIERYNLTPEETSEVVATYLSL